MSKMKGMLPEIKLFLQEMLTFMSIGYVATTYGVGGTQCVGPSMLPTFRENGDFVLYDSFSYKIMSDEYKAGDVVICVCPYDPSKSVCKRVAAVAGDSINVSDNDFSSIVPESVRVPPGHCWLLGDNPGNSLDSRRYGFVPTGLIKGKVMCKFRFSAPFVHQIETLEQTRRIRAANKKMEEKLKEIEMQKQKDAQVESNTVTVSAAQGQDPVDRGEGSTPVHLTDLLNALDRQQQAATDIATGTGTGTATHPSAHGGLTESDRDAIRVAVEKIKRDSCTPAGTAVANASDKDTKEDIQ